MAFKVSDIVTSAVNTYYDNPGTANDFITPTMQIDWCYQSVMEIWKKMVDQELGYFAIRESTFPNFGGTQIYTPLSVVPNTSIYPLPNASTTTAQTSQSVAFLSRVFVRQGSGAPYTYLPVPPVIPTDRFFLKMSSMLYPINGFLGQSPGFFWSSQLGGMDANGNATWNVEFSPTPQITADVVYDGWRYPAKPAAVTDYLDLPEQWRMNVILRLIKKCYLREKADLGEINNEIKMEDADTIRIEKRGIMRDGAELVKEVN